jgi:DNA polymerase
MIVGEAPGRNEDETGVPFVGKAGERLNEVLSLAGLSRDSVFVANVLKCRPPGNRNPRPAEVVACSGFLLRQIRALNPQFIVTFGNFATQFVLGTKQGVSELHGRLVEDVVVASSDDDGEPCRLSVYPVFHPAATIYRPQWRPVLEDDMRRFGEMLKGRRETNGDWAGDGSDG